MTSQLKAKRPVQREDAPPEETELVVTPRELRQGALHKIIAGDMPNVDQRRITLLCPEQHHYDLPNDASGWRMLCGMGKDDIIVIHPVNPTPKPVLADVTRRLLEPPPLPPASVQNTTQHNGHRPNSARPPSAMSYTDDGEVPDGFCAPCCQGYIYYYSYYKQHGPYETELDEKGLAGPRKHGRTCTNPIALAVFLTFVIGWLAIVGVAVQKGDPYRVLRGIDSFGNVCGRKNDEHPNNGNYYVNMEAHRFLYWTDPTDTLAPRVCVQQCPYDGQRSKDTLEACSDCASNSTESGTCGPCVRYGTCVSSTGSSPYVDQASLPWGASNNWCPPFVYASRAVATRCWPASETYDNSTVSFAGRVPAAFVDRIDDTEDDTALLYEFFFSTRNQILYAVLVGLLPLLVIHFVVFRHDAAVLHRETESRHICGLFPDPRPAIREIGLTYAIIVPGLGLLWWKWERAMSDRNDKRENGIGASDAEELMGSAFLFMACVATFCACGLAIYVVVEHKDIRARTIKSIAEASHVLTEAPVLFLCPLSALFVLAGILSLWAYCSLFILSMDDRKVNHETGYVSYEFENNPTQGEHWLIWVYHCVAIVWFASFVVTASDFIISGVTTQWYFENNKTDSPRVEQMMTLKASFFMTYTLTRYHIGTVAASSVLTIFSWFTLRVIVPIQKAIGKIPWLGDSIGFALCCCYMPRDYSVLLKSYHTHANILVCLHGYDLPTAAQTAHVRLGNNYWAQVVLNDLGVFLILLGKIQVAAMTGIAAFSFIESGNEGGKTSHSYGSWIVVLSCFVIGWTCAAIVLAVYSSVSTAIAACVMEDREFNEINGHPTYAPRGLIDSLGAPPAVKRYADVFGGAGDLIDRITGGHIQRQTEEFLAHSVSGKQAGQAVGRLVDASLAWKQASAQVYNQFRSNMQLAVATIAPTRTSSQTGNSEPIANNRSSTAPQSGPAVAYEVPESMSRRVTVAGASDASNARTAPPVYSRNDQRSVRLTAGVVGTLVATAEMFHSQVGDNSPEALVAWSTTLNQNVSPFIQAFFGVSPIQLTEMVVGLINLHDQSGCPPATVVDVVGPSIAKHFGVDPFVARLGASFALLASAPSEDPEVRREQVGLLGNAALALIKDRLGDTPFGLAMAVPGQEGQGESQLTYRNQQPVPVYVDVPHGAWGQMSTV